jgi:hypothetical protein
MSFGVSQESPFIGPLRGHTVTLLVGGRSINLVLAKSLLSKLAGSGVPCTVLDIDALYSSNSDYIISHLTSEEASLIEFLVPDPDSDLEDDVGRLLSSGSDRVLIVDSLNSLYHLMSTGRHNAKNRSLAFVVALLSLVAKTEDRVVFLTMYRREKRNSFVRAKSISDLSDSAIAVSRKGQVLSLKCERGTAWPARDFAIPIT